MTTQDEMIEISRVLEKMGYQVTEIYNAAGFLRIFIDGKETTLGGMMRLWRG